MTMYATQFRELVESFPLPSADLGGLLNGSVFRLLETNDRKTMQTAHMILETSNPDCTVVSLNVSIRRLADSVIRLKKRIAKEWPRLVAFMNEPLKMPTKKAASEPRSAPPLPEPEEVEVLPRVEPSAMTLKGDCTKCAEQRQVHSSASAVFRKQVMDSKRQVRNMTRLFSVRRVNQERARSAKQKERLRAQSRSCRAENKKLKAQVATLQTDLSVDWRAMLAAQKRKTKQVERQLNQTRLSLRSERLRSADLSQYISNLEADLGELRTELEAQQSKNKDNVSSVLGKTYTTQIRKCIYTCLASQVPIEKAGPIISYVVSELTGHTVSKVPSSSTSAQMAYEMGAIPDLQVAEELFRSRVATLSWDATSLKGEHVNEVHISVGDRKSLTIQVQGLPGGKAEDYIAQISSSLIHLSSAYALYNKVEQPLIFAAFQRAISSTLTDRAAVNKCVTDKLSQQLGKDLVLLNCNLHPLDGLATTAKKTLRTFDSERGITGRAFGVEGTAANLVRGLSKMRYNQRSGDPNGFVTFLTKSGLSPGLMPRYVGNRLHILFHLSGVIFSKRPDLLQYLKKYCTSQQLRLSLLSDLQNEDISVQLQALGLFGKLLTGPWMKELYCGEEEMSHMEGTPKLIRCVENLRSVEADPSILVSSTDCLFGEPLQDDDETLRQLRAVPSHHAEVLPEIIKKLAGAFVVLLDRQLLRYLQGPLSEPTPSLLDVTSAAPVHNMHSERTLGRFDAQFRRAPIATIGFLDGKVKWQSNKTAEWLNSKPSAEQREIVSFAISQGARNRSALKQKEQEITNVKRQRQVELAQRRDRTDRKKVEQKVTDFLTTGTEGDLFCDLSEDMVHLFHTIKNTDSAAVSGVKCTHTWDVDGEDVVFQAELVRFETFKRKPCLVIAYQEDATTAATESKIPVSEFLTDALFNDVTLL